MVAHSKPARPGRKQLAALAGASAGFYFTFASWGLMENLISTYYAKLGYYSMSLVYFGIGPGALIAPAVIAKFGARRSMVLGCSTYTLCEWRRSGSAILPPPPLLRQFIMSQLSISVMCPSGVLLLPQTRSPTS